MNLTLKVWRQKSEHAPGRLAEYEARDIPAEASFLEMLDIVNERLIEAGGDPIAFDHDCREGICGMCSLTINGRPHGGEARRQHLPAPHAGVSRRRDHRHRAVPGPRFPGGP